jgi:DNA-binding CsgD family transcriptional regulator
MKDLAEKASSDPLLSEREKEILLLVCKGLSTLQITTLLGLSKRTGDSHRANIRAKTGCRNAASLVAYAIRERLVKF